MGRKKFIPNTVAGSRKGSKYPERVKTAALFELLTDTNIHQVAKRYGIPESTLRGWLKQAREAPDGGAGVWQRAREDAVRQITVQAARDAARTLELMRRRLEVGAENLARVEQIDGLMLGAARAEGLVTDAAGVVLGEIRDQKTLAPEFARQLEAERARRAAVIPADFTLSNYLRTLTAVSARGAGEAVHSDKDGATGLEQLLEAMQGDEF